MKTRSVEMIEGEAWCEQSRYVTPSMVFDAIASQIQVGTMTR